jgi:hypothetical protein
VSLLPRPAGRYHVEAYEAYLSEWNGVARMRIATIGAVAIEIAMTLGIAIRLNAIPIEAQIPQAPTRNRFESIP